MTMFNKSFPFIKKLDDEKNKIEINKNGIYLTLRSAHFGGKRAEVYSKRIFNIKKKKLIYKIKQKKQIILATGVILYPIPYIALKLMTEIGSFEVAYFGIHKTIDINNLLFNDNISKFYTKDCVREGTYYCQLSFLLDDGKGGK